MELWGRTKQLKQKVSESVLVWLPQLWGDGTDNMQLNPQEMSQIISMVSTFHVRLVLQDAQRMTPEAGNRTMINWFMAAIFLLWDNPGDLSEQVTI